MLTAGNPLSMGPSICSKCMNHAKEGGSHVNSCSVHTGSTVRGIQCKVHLPFCTSAGEECLLHPQMPAPAPPCQAHAPRHIPFRDGRHEGSLLWTRIVRWHESCLVFIFWHERTRHAKRDPRFRYFLAVGNRAIGHTFTSNGNGTCRNMLNFNEYKIK